MTIYELEARFKLGPVEVGKKIGEPVPNHGALLRYRIIHENAGEHWFARFMYRVPLFNVPFAWWTEALHSFRVSTRQLDEVRLRGSQQPWCQDCNQHIVGDEINQHPLLSKSLRYIPD